METCPLSLLGGRCGALLREDTQFTAEMSLYSLPQRRYVCASGHTVYVSMPVLGDPTPALARPRGTRGRTLKVCPQCEESFLGVSRQLYCGVACAHAREVERAKRRRPDGRYGLTGAALQRARAIPSSWTRGTAPRPYPRGTRA